MKLEGLYTAIITPFDTYGKLDKEGLKKNLQFQIQSGVDGIVVLGTTGESPTLTSQEKQTIIEIAVQEVKDKVTLMVGAGSYATNQTIEATRQAQEMGADAALIVTPYYNKPTQEGMYRHFAAICEAVSLPICVYNIQGRTGQNLQTETLKCLSNFPSIIGVKEASGNIQQMSDVLEIISRKHPNFNVVSGDDALTLPLMALGGHGVISVISNLIPSPMRSLVKAVLSKNFDQARDWHYQLLPFFRAAFIETNPIPIKAAMQLCGMAAGPCRLPLCDLIPENFEKLKAIISKLPSSWLKPYGQT